MKQSQIQSILKTGGVYALGKKLRPGADIKRKSLINWTRRWLIGNKISIPEQRGRKPIMVDFQPDPYTGGIKPTKAK